MSRFVAWLRAPAENVIVLEGGQGRCAPVTVNRHLAALFCFYDYQARNGVALAQSLVEWRRSNRGGYRPFLHHVTAGRPTPTRPLRLRQSRRLPRTLTSEQIIALVEACEHLRDRFLLVLLAETGMRVGQALGLRHADFVSHRRELRIVPREDNVNGARAKTLETATIPISAGLVRLYSAYMFDEYGERDCDYVFVNLFGSADRDAAAVSGGPQAGRPAAGPHRHRVHPPHAAALPGDRPAARWGERRGGGRLLTHRSSTTTSQTYIHLDVEDLRAELTRCGALRNADRNDAADRGVTDDAPPVSSDEIGHRPMSAVSRPRRPARHCTRSAPGDELERHYAGDAWHASALGISAARGRGTVSVHQGRPSRGCGRPSSGGLAAAAGHRLRVQHDPDRRPGVLPLLEASWPSCQPPVERSAQLDRALVERYLAWLAPQALSDSTKALSRMFLRVFLEENRRYGWVAADPGRGGPLRRRGAVPTAARCPGSSPSS